MTYPPPHDLEAERVVLSAVLCDEVTATELRLATYHFLAPVHKVTWGTMLAMDKMGLHSSSEPETWVWVSRVVADHRPHRWDITVRELGQIRGLMHTARAAREAAPRLRELDRHRQLIRAMQRLDAQLRTGVVPSRELVRWTMRRLDLLRGDPLEVRL
jgi:replicative DNA helicase